MSFLFRVPITILLTLHIVCQPERVGFTRITVDGRLDKLGRHKV